MLDPSRTVPPGGAQSRLRTYMAALLVLGAVVLLFALQRPEPGSDRLAEPPEDPAATAPPLEVEKEEIPARDDALAHAGWQREALDYLLPLSQLKLGTQPESILPSALDDLPFEDARGSLYEVEGTVLSMTVEEYASGGVLWSVLLEGDEGGRLLVIKQALASDAAQGRPEDALEYSTEYIEEGDRILTRGIYAQRRTGTFGGILVKDPLPVLVAQPPVEAFRKVLPPAVPIEDPGEADWDEIRDRYLADTKNLEEPALFQMIEWARERGHAAIVADIESGEIPVENWGQETFVEWSEEVEAPTPESPRPFTESARGRLFKTTGLFASYVHEGWNKVGRAGSRWGVNDYGTIGLLSDHYGNTFFKSISAFPLSTYEGVEGKMGEHIRLYGYFLKNHTYDTSKSREGGGRAQLTMPFFVVVHAEPVVFEPSPYRQLIWVIAGVIVLLALLFYGILIRGERKEAARMQAYRMKLKKRIRESESKAPPPDPGAS